MTQQLFSNPLEKAGSGLLFKLATWHFLSGNYMDLKES